jgi:hypothetical protein
MFRIIQKCMIGVCFFGSSNRARQNHDKQRQPTFGNPKNFPGEYVSPPARHFGEKYQIRCCYVNLGMEMGIRGD